MKSWARNILWAALGVAVLMSLLWELVPLPDAGDRLDALPMQGLNFAGRAVPLSPIEELTYQPARVLKRIYRVGRQHVELLVLDGSRNRHAVHDPLYCFRGAGWRVSGTRYLALPGGHAQLVQLANGGDAAEVLCWITDGTVRHLSAPRYWLQTTLRRLTFGRSGPEPVLVVMQPLRGEAVVWERVLQDFPALLEL